VPLARAAFVYTSFVNTSLLVICAAGLMINFVAGLVWGLMVKWMKDDYETNDGLQWRGLSAETVAMVLLAYGLPKGVLQWGFGFAGDRLGRKWLIVTGQVVVAVGLLITFITGEATTWAWANSDPTVGFYVGAAVMGVGTGIMYSNALAAVCDHVDPSWRSSALGAYRFWRDAGWAVGALFTGLYADAFGVGGAWIFTCVLTCLSAAAVAFFYVEVSAEVLGCAAPEEVLDQPIEEAL